ncbi:MAG: glycoside hydrolase family 2 TIM barrel-domain containing protein [Promethearchaeia archaeon]
MKTLNLNGTWQYLDDKDGEGMDEKWYLPQNIKNLENTMGSIDIPKSFNILEGFKLYEGPFWHFRTLDIPPSTSIDNDTDLFIKFNGANYLTKVWLNGQYLGEHKGGFVPFRFKINSALKESNNLLVVMTDNTRKHGQVPDLSFDWFNYGGIYRDVELLALNKNRVEDVVVKTKVDTQTEAIINVSFTIHGSLPFTWQILDTDKEMTLFEGRFSKISEQGNFSVTLTNPKLWSPRSPHLYYLRFFNTSGAVIYETHFGIREIEVQGNYVYLNKRRIYMRGVSLHEEQVPYGRTIPYEKREEDIRNMKQIGFNALRTAHYSHDESLIEIADRLGLLILEEIPVYWACDFKSNEVFKTAARMARSLIKRDINHPSVVWWSVGNEVPIERLECARFMRRLMEWVRRFDDTRIVTYVSNKMICDLTKRYADIAAINLYFGWYYGSPKMVSTVLDVIRAPILNQKPVFYTEFGAGAKYGYRPGWELQKRFSEEKQLYVLDYTIRTLNSKPYLAGWFIWIYRDFRSFLRQNEYQQGFNRKGIVSERNEKKLISYRIPQILNKKRKLTNTKYLGILLWIVLYPFAFLFTYLMDLLMKFGQQRRIQEGKEKEKARLERSKT